MCECVRSASVLVLVLLLVLLPLTMPRELVQGWGPCVTMSDRLEASRAYDMTWGDVGEDRAGGCASARREEKGNGKKK